jgi:hypothetical protein
MKNKIFFMLVCLTVLVTFLGCQKNSELQKGEYITEDNISTVILYDDNKFSFIRHIATSYTPTGTYSIEKDKLVLSVTDDEYYTFLVKDGQIIFDSCLPLEAALIDKGTVFQFVPENNR